MMRRLARRKATREEIARCVRDDPCMALIFAEPLTSDQIAACATRVPATAIAFVWHRLSSEMQAKCIRRAPAMALEIIPHELTQEQFFYCKRRAPRAARQTMAQFYELEFKRLESKDQN